MTTRLTAADLSSIADVTGFWRDAGPDAWFRKDDGFDTDFRTRHSDLHWRAARRELDHWNSSPDGALALMILLDQFPRNCFRGTAHMFATDSLARHYARDAVAAGHDKNVAEELRAFIYLPFEHSEDMADQVRAVELFAPLGDEMLKYAIVHRDIIEKFGRFPHRNRALGRETTADEQAFLEAGGFAG
jgi:uncharacterized protein (DUF924 family)